MDHAVRVGMLLHEAKEKLRHGGWSDWVTRHCAFSIRSAQRYMTLPGLVDSLGSKATRVSHLPLRDLVRLQRLDDVERKGVVDLLGNGDADTTLKEAIQVHRTRVKEEDRIAAATTEPFGRLLAAGVVALISAQAMIGVGMSIGLMPITGMTLPFVSYGGSSLLSNFIAAALLVSVSQHRPFLLSTKPFKFAEDHLVKPHLAECVGATPAEEQHEAPQVRG